MSKAGGDHRERVIFDMGFNLAQNSAGSKSWGDCRDGPKTVAASVENLLYKTKKRSRTVERRKNKNSKCNDSSNNLLNLDLSRDHLGVGFKCTSQRLAVPDQCICTPTECELSTLLLWRTCPKLRVLPSWTSYTYL